MKIAWYTSGHGFGHISRSSVVIQTILDKSPENKIAVMSPRVSFLPDRVGLEKRNVKTDVGMIQKTSIDLDVPQTMLAIQEFEKNKNKIIVQEIQFLEQFAPEVIVTDVSSLPVILGKNLRIPTLVMGNFTWDFIYQYYGKYHSFFSDYSQKLHEEYLFADERIVLPFHCLVPPEVNPIFIGIIGRKPKHTKDECRAIFNFSPSNTYILLSFGAYGIDYHKLQMENLPDDVFLVVADAGPSFHHKMIHLENIWYPDLVAACDFVLTKPGYGILSECYFGKTPIIYTDRGDFPEYKYLVESLQRYFNSWYISQEDLFSLNLNRILNDFERKQREVLDDGLDELLEILEEKSYK